MSSDAEKQQVSISDEEMQQLAALSVRADNDPSVLENVDFEQMQKLLAVREQLVLGETKQTAQTFQQSGQVAYDAAWGKRGVSDVIAT